MLKLWYFGHRMQRATLHRKRLMLGKIEGRRRRGRQDEMVGWHHQLSGHVSEQTPGDSEWQGSWCGALHGVTGVRQDLATEQQRHKILNCYKQRLSVSSLIVRVLSCLSPVWLFATVWIIAHWAPLSMGFSRQECWSGLNALLQEIFPNQGSNPHLCLLRCRQFLYHWAPGKPFSLGTWEIKVNKQSLLLWYI